ncbi:MAG: hypothetical protein P3W94_006490 [Paracoccus sp. (in: a-proteobacteria)]|nr:hypothetical protein [Paracoccus sp. (in: a-proteobacteria)]
MIELFFVTCLIAEPQSCRDNRLPFNERDGLVTCMMQGQNEIARWLERHPTERVREWTCRYADKRARRA